ncbi:MAG: acetyl-CoA carboxylase biotin carboxylase subunit [Burkholderiaceae bacterium]|nr:acetyl-CoA carboxylase biotin carboxylase subunit [Burkholderiaceae bacterium]
MRRPIRRVFVANRGEIAVRIVEACHRLGIEAVVGVSDADRDTLAALRADRAVCIGPARATDSYLRKEAIVAAALGTGCDAVHPGYGFLSERATFRRYCAEHGLIFVGPSAEAIGNLGDKLRARRIAESLGVPTVPGSDHVESAADARRFGEREGYPFLLKASAGGGGRGMRIVRDAAEVDAAHAGASAEAAAAFGDPTLYIERYIERARHVEVQVLGDSFGNVVHLGERDCSTQRRHQKLLEEGPSPILDDAVRRRMATDAVKLARHVGYEGAGTVEFIVDLDTKSFYFLEMNTRIQVEHPVTEMITGRDLVVEMIRIASGEALSFGQDDVAIRGHAIECRINAEDFRAGFRPSPGQLRTWSPPSGPGIRLDSHCYAGYRIPPFYDSMIGKLLVHANDRTQAIEKMRDALEAFVIEGIETTIPFHRMVLSHPDFRENRVTTRWVENVLTRPANEGPESS